MSSIVAAWLGVLLAILGFGYTYCTNNAQDARALAQARPRFVYTSARAVAYEELTKEEALRRDWAYQPLVFPHSEDFLQGKQLRRYSELVLWDPRARTRLFGNAPVPTVREARAEANRLGIKEFDVRQLFSFGLDLRNAGQLPASEVWVEVECADQQTQQVLVTTRKPPVSEVAGGADFNISYTMDLPITRRLPEHLWAKITIGYMMDSREQTPTVIDLDYDSRLNRWSWTR